MITFPEICNLCPEVADLRDDAASVAEHERWPWYEMWLSGSTVFSVAVKAAAQRLGVDLDEIRDVVLVGLLDAYRTAKWRLERRKRKTAVA